MAGNWAREEAFLILNSIMIQGKYSGIETRNRLNNSNLKSNDRALVTEIVNGTLRNLIKIDWIISKFINRKIEKLSNNVKNILRSGIYQIIYLDRVPDSAVCNESVELAKKYSNIGAARFINGVLRNVSRQKDSINTPDETNISKYLSIEFSHPLWLVELWIKNYGIEFTKNLLKANNEAPPLTVRVNRLKISKEELLFLFNSNNIMWSEGCYNDEAINIKGISSLKDSILFKKGYFQIQDESSMLVSKILNPKPGDFIIDVCSAPGGKATHMAELMSNKGRIIARDIHLKKLKLIEENIKRLGISIIETEIFDANTIDDRLIDKADAVLVDAPCSGLGLVRRRSDLRWKKEKEDIEKLSKLQINILKNASLYVKKNGVLVYSTCTLNDKENIQILKDFLNYNKQFSLDSMERFLPSNFTASRGKEGFIELYPHIHGTDGFFIAKMVKVGCMEGK
ncbi:MAG: 16S rRNA (cytosine(967)-C(5))-methyltransferase RsmB [Firmicutes bacterium]|nr:16S rRNA (cytosine(967)-C(5))-methyltransferase RsmB [Bacillota bacterium]